MRASRPHFGIDRERFIAAHVALRRALAEQSALRADTLCTGLRPVRQALDARAPAHPLPR